MPSDKARVLAMKAMGQVRLPTLRNAIMSHSLSQEWFATSDKNMLTLSLRPREEQLVPHLAMQKPATRLASHLCITRRGVVVLVNCDLEECKEPLALAVAHASPLEVESGPAMSSAATAATAFETAQAPSGGVQRVLRMLGVGPRPPPAPSSSPLPVMPFEGPAAVSNMELRRISDYMTVEVRRSLEGWCALEEGTLVVKRLDLESVRVIAGALEQSILLQVYEGGADRLHAEAAWLNERVRVRAPALALCVQNPLLAGGAALPVAPRPSAPPVRLEPPPCPGLPQPPPPPFGAAAPAARA